MRSFVRSATVADSSFANVQVKFSMDSYRDWIRNLSLTAWTTHPHNMLSVSYAITEKFQEPFIEFLAPVGQQFKLSGSVHCKEKRKETYVTDTLKAPIIYTVGFLRE